MIEPFDYEEANKHIKVSPKDTNEADRRYKGWLRKIRRMNNWRPVKKVQAGLFAEPGVLLINNEKIVEKYGLQWADKDADGSTDEDSDE